MYWVLGQRACLQQQRPRTLYIRTLCPRTYCTCTWNSLLVFSVLLVFTTLACSVSPGRGHLHKTHTHTHIHFVSSNVTHCYRKTLNISNLTIKINVRKDNYFSENQFGFAITWTKHVLTYLLQITSDLFWKDYSQVWALVPK